jgi:hypothetical protein
MSESQFQNNLPTSTEENPSSKSWFQDINPTAALVFFASGFGAAAVTSRAFDSSGSPVTVERLVSASPANSIDEKVECTGVLSYRGLEKVTVSEGGVVMVSSTSVAHGVAPYVPPRIEERPVFILRSSADSEGVLPVFKSSMPHQTWSEHYVTEEIEKKVQAGENLNIRLDGFATIRDGQRVIIYDRLRVVDALEVK